MPVHSLDIKRIPTNTMALIIFIFGL